VVSDELGNAIVSAAHNNGLFGAHYSILSPGGNQNCTLFVPENLETNAQSLVYAGNNVFYSNNRGSLNDTGMWFINKFSYTILPAYIQEDKPIQALIYPNPTTGVFRWNNTDRLCTEIKISNLSGRVVATIPVNGTEDVVLNLENEPAGLYLVNTGKTMYKLNVVR